MGSLHQPSHRRAAFRCASTRLGKASLAHQGQSGFRGHLIKAARGPQESLRCRERLCLWAKRCIVAQWKQMRRDFKLGSFKMSALFSRLLQRDAETRACQTKLGEGQAPLAQAIHSPGLAWFSYQRERNLALQRHPGKTAPPPSTRPSYACNPRNFWRQRLFWRGRRGPKGSAGGAPAWVCLLRSSRTCGK